MIKTVVTKNFKCVFSRIFLDLAKQRYITFPKIPQEKTIFCFSITFHFHYLESRVHFLLFSGQKKLITLIAIDVIL